LLRLLELAEPLKASQVTWNLRGFFVFEGRNDATPADFPSIKEDSVYGEATISMCSFHAREVKGRCFLGEWTCLTEYLFISPLPFDISV
jgi:hypothetical protein